MPSLDKENMPDPAKPAVNRLYIITQLDLLVNIQVLGVMRDFFSAHLLVSVRHSPTRAHASTDAPQCSYTRTPTRMYPYVCVHARMH